MKNLPLVIAAIAAAALSGCAGQPYQAQPHSQTSQAQMMPSFGQSLTQGQNQGQPLQRAAPAQQDRAASMDRERARTAASVDRNQPIQALFNEAELQAYSVIHYGERCYVELKLRQPPTSLPGCDRYVEALGAFMGYNDVLGPRIKQEVKENYRSKVHTNGDYAKAAAVMEVVAKAMNEYADSL